MTCESGQGAPVPWPQLAARLSYKPGWVFKIGGPMGRKLCVFATTPDSLDETRQRTTQHMFDLPDVDDVREQMRWVLACLLDAERHEASEFLRLDGVAPFWPNHQDEGSAYSHVERWEMLCP